MKQLTKTYLTILLIGICAGWSARWLINKGKPVEPIVVHTTDTVFFYKWDTLSVIKPIFITKKIVDTITVYSKDSVKIHLPVEQKYYEDKDRYQAWISGYEPSLDSINVFNKTEYQTITNHTKETIYKNAWNAYLGLQISTFDGNVIPTINLMIASPKKLSFGAGIGLYDNKPVCNLSLGYKIFEK